MAEIAHAAVPVDADQPRIAAEAGNSDVDGRRYEAGILYVSGVSQAALDAAVAAIGTAPVVPVPDLTPLQMCQGLYASGMLADVEALIAAGPVEMRLAWERASVIRRQHPMIAAIAAQIGLSDQAVDLLFRDAAKT